MGVRPDQIILKKTLTEIEVQSKVAPPRRSQVGRKIRNQELEEFVLKFIHKYIEKHSKVISTDKFLARIPKRREIMTYSKTFKKKGAFKGSKGWCDKFMIRNRKTIESWMTDQEKKKSEMLKHSR